MKPKQLRLPGFNMPREYTCPLCGEVKPLFGQYTPIMDWGVCRECSIKYPYPVELFVPSTRRNKDREPLMIDPSPELADLRERRIHLDEMLRCAVDPSRLERPVVKYNLSGLELHYPIRRSKAHKYQQMHNKMLIGRQARQISLPICRRCGTAHERSYELLPGSFDYYDTCQHCNDEERVEALYRHQGIFGGDDVEAVMDRLNNAFPELFERGILPDYWFVLLLQDYEAVS